MTTVGYLGLDIGGTGAKAGVYSVEGQLLGYGQVRYTPSVTAEGHVEIPIEVIHEAARDATRQAVLSSRVPIEAMSIASQGQTFVVLDSDDRPLYPGILWYDSRAIHESDLLRKALDASNVTGGPLPLAEVIAVAPKFMWLCCHNPDLTEKTARISLLPDYFNRCLSGESVTDPCTASTTGLYVEGAPDYHADALRLAGINRQALAMVRDPGTKIGKILHAVADEWMLTPDTLLVTGTNDQYAGALGAGNCQEGILTETTGTCLALVSLYRLKGSRLAESPGLLRGQYPIPGYGFVLAYTKTAGLILDWFQNAFGRTTSIDDLLALAARSPAGSHGINVLPHFDGAVSPIPNGSVRGAIWNLRLDHTQGDIFRAVLESIAYSLRENMEAMRAHGQTFNLVRSIGGGARSDFWVQMKADVIGMAIEKPQVTESATLGAAMLAAVGAGEYANVAECSSSWYKVGRVFTPRPDQHALYEPAYFQYRALYQHAYGMSV